MYRTHQEVVQQAQEFKDALTKSDAAAIAKKNGVRYSDLLRLPYFDIVRMCATDPMHTFLLGMVKRETELNLQFLNTQEKQEFLRRVKSVKMPYDMGRLPTNVFDREEGITGITAAQWMNYIICYARPCLYKLLPERPYKCMVLLSQIVTIISSPVFTHDDLASLYRLQKEHHQLFSQVYGKWSMTVNYHMSIHITDSIYELGPPHSFWSYSYERLNGILAGTPNSNRCIEVEVMNRFIRAISFSNFNTPGIDITSAVPSNLREFVASEEDCQHPPYPQTFWVLRELSCAPEKRFERQLEVERGEVSDWPLQLKHPCKMYVKMQTSLRDEIHSYLEELYGSKLEYVKPRLHKFGRCEVNGQNFSSDFNSTDRGSIVKAVFCTSNEDELSPYFGVVKFFFRVTTLIEQTPKNHDLAYVTWLKFRSNSRQMHSLGCMA